MNFSKRLFVGILTLVMLLCVVPFGSLSVQAAPEADPGTDPYFEDIQCAEWPMNYLNFSRTNTKIDLDQDLLDENKDRIKDNEPTSGHRAYAMDVYGGNKKVLAPFDMKIVYIYQGSHMVVIESEKPVRFANGTVDYMTCVFIHDDNIKDLWVGKTFKQGDKFYDQGDYGLGSEGTHVHIEAAVGKGYCPTQSQKDYYKHLEKIRANGIQLWDAFYLSPAAAAGSGNRAVTVVNESNAKIMLDWKVRQKVTFHSNVSGTADLVRHYPVNAPFGSLPTPVNNGKAFDGWYTAKTGGTKVTDLTVVTKNHTHLYARWKDMSASATDMLANTKITMSAAPIGQTDAKLKVSANISYMYNYVPLQLGFYIGTNPKYLTKYEKNQIITGSQLKRGVGIQLSLCDLQLRPGMKYYYQFYVMDVEGKDEIRSNVASFQTPATQTKKVARTHVEWRKQKASATKSTATISATVNLKNIYSTKMTAHIDYAGFYFGEAANKLTKATATTSYNTKKETFNLSYDLAKSGIAMKSGKTYFYQFYVVANGIEYTSGIRSFKAKANTTGKVQTTTPSQPGNSGQTTTPSQPANSGQTTTPSQPGNSGQTTQTPALNPTWSKYKVDKVSQSNATIYSTVTYGKKLKADYCGFYLGTTKNNLTKAKKNDTVTESRNYTDMWYDMNKYGFTLNADTTYYYQFYLIVDGVEYKSDVKSFTTAKAAAGLNPVWSEHKTSNVTKTDATFSCKVTYGKTILLQRGGFYIGTSKDKLVKAEKYDKANANRNYSLMSYNMKKYGITLKAGTTYYYRFYVTIGGKEYLSDIRSFTTAK